MEFTVRSVLEDAPMGELFGGGVTGYTKLIVCRFLASRKRLGDTDAFIRQVQSMLDEPTRGESRVTMREQVAVPRAIAEGDLNRHHQLRDDAASHFLQNGGHLGMEVTKLARPWGEVVAVVVGGAGQRVPSERGSATEIQVPVAAQDKQLRPAAATRGGGPAGT